MRRAAKAMTLSAPSLLHEPRKQNPRLVNMPLLGWDEERESQLVPKAINTENSWSAQI